MIMKNWFLLLLFRVLLVLVIITVTIIIDNGSSSSSSFYCHGWLLRPNNIINSSRSYYYSVNNNNNKKHDVRTTKLYTSSSSSSSPQQQQQQQQQKNSRKINNKVLEIFHNTECDNMNMPPSLNVLYTNLDQLTTMGSNTDIRGTFIDHNQNGSLENVSHAIKHAALQSDIPALTPFTSYCIGQAVGKMILADTYDNEQDIVIAIGHDPRPHGIRLADSLARGLESISERVRVIYCGTTTTPACAAFCKMKLCNASVMVTASHLPVDRNGYKFFSTTSPTGFSNAQIRTIGELAKQSVGEWFNRYGIIPPSSGTNAIMCSQHNTNWMIDYYAKSLKDAILTKTKSKDGKPLQGLKIVLNAGNGSGGFFLNVLNELGADTTGSFDYEPDGNFPNGVPNPEYAAMIEQTITACQNVNADIGIMLDTDADRCGFVVPSNSSNNNEYEPLNRNRLIALLGVIFAEEYPNCAIVTDSCTSEGLSNFLQNKLKLKHIRYLKGYANVINKAKELTESGIYDAQLAIETSGHCAMEENSYLDDGTYTAVQIVCLLARLRNNNQNNNNNNLSLLDLISDMEELDIFNELRMTTDSLESMKQIFTTCMYLIESVCCYNDNDDETNNNNKLNWIIDRDNLEGIRVRLGEQQYFMLRKSLHDPVISLQIETKNIETARTLISQPLYKLFNASDNVRNVLDLSALKNY